MSLIQRVFFLLTRIMVMVAIICAFGLASTLAVAGIKKNAKLDHHIPDVVKANAKDNAVYVTRLKLSAIAGHGSGCLISSSGLVLTNWHVVLPLLANNSYNMKVDWLPWAPLLGNSTATIIYVAPEIDLALIKLDKLPGKEGAKFADQVSPTDRIYPIGFTSGSDEGAVRKWWEVIHNDLVRTIDTGEITGTYEYSYSDTLNRPPLGENIDDWHTLINNAEKFLKSNHIRPKLKSDPNIWNAFLTNAWVTGGQSGGPCFGEDGKLIALNHSSAWKDGNILINGKFEGSIMIPVDLLKLFLVGVQDNGNIHNVIISKFDEIGGIKTIGLPYAADGHPFVKKNRNGIIQEFKQQGNDSGIALEDGAKQTFWVHGAIWKHWMSKGGPIYLGYPKSDEYDVNEGRKQDFEKGSLTWVKASDKVYMTPKDAPSVTAPVTQLPKIKVNPKDSAEIIYIPAGDFLMGSTDADKDANDNEKPQRKVYLDAYYIYKTEVTVAQYRKFCAATVRKMPNAPAWGWKENHPVVNVSWNDAKAYADWAGVVLPTEAQWEKAARGTDGRIYPWGNDWDKKKCANYANSGEGTQPIGGFPMGASPYGVLDMAGNAWEWCGDRYGETYYKTALAKNPTGPVTGNYRVLRGGSWIDGNDYVCRGAYRSIIGYFPYCYDGYIGFRCASPGP